jgi:FkbM family methyltransferase
MKVKSHIRKKILTKLPAPLRLSIERFYFYYYCGPSYIANDVKLFKKLCSINKNSIDIGANEGDLTLFLSKLSSHVYCFEPAPTAFLYLKNRFKNTNVTVHNYALGDINEHRYLNIPSTPVSTYETRSTFLSDFKNEMILGNKVTQVKKHKVKVKRLDRLSINNVGFVKIDVEGFEYNVLKGAKETIIQNMTNIFIEIEQRFHNDTKIDEVFQYILDFGYFGYFMYKNKLLDITQFDLYKMQDVSKQNTDFYVNNFVFSPLPLNHT